MALLWELLYLPGSNSFVRVGVDMATVVATHVSREGNLVYPTVIGRCLVSGVSRFYLPS